MTRIQIEKSIQIEKAIEWFKSKDIPAAQYDEGVLTIVVGDYNVIVSDSEISHRAALYDAYMLEITDVDGNVLRVGDNVVAIDVEDLEGDCPERGETLRVNIAIDKQSNYIDFISNKDNKPYGFYGHRVLKLK